MFLTSLGENYFFNNLRSVLKAKFLAKMERRIKNLELKKSGNFCFYLCEFLPAMSSVESSSKLNLLCFFFSFCG